MFNLEKIHQKLIVSCQPEAQESFYDLHFIQGMAQAAALGGAGGLRLNHPKQIAAVKAKTKLPVIGIWKQEHPQSEVYITPTLESALALQESGCEIIALDATHRTRPNQDTLQDIVKALKDRGSCLMADISTLEEGIQAAEMGFDCIGTTLSGYTPYSTQSEGPDFALLKTLTQTLDIPIIMEGKVSSPEDVKTALGIGAWAVVVGSAITRPQWITRQFVKGTLI